MRNLISTQHGSSRFARFLVLVALLCAVAIPVVEACHLHTPGDISSSDCLLYKSPAVLPLVAAAPALALLVFSDIAPQRAGAVEVAHRFQPRQTRGPPSHS